MNPLNINHIKVENANAIKLRYQNLRKITRFFRIFEIILIIAVVSRVSFQLPLEIFKLSNECIHNISIILVSPPFVFILGNAIVITLFVNSGQFHSNEPNIKPPKTRPNTRIYSKTEQKHVKKQDKEEENTMMAMIFSPSEQHNNNNTTKALIPIKLGRLHEPSEQQVTKIYRRSQSAKVNKGVKIEGKCCGLRRSNTEIKSLKDVGQKCCKESREGYKHYPEDHMSSDEFRKTIENFIAKQQKFLREEECFTLEG